MGKNRKHVYKIMENIKISFITTVLNEEENISALLNSLRIQSKKPSEIIVVDGGSKDTTVEIIKSYKKKFNKIHIDFRLLIYPGNRSVGRNIAIKNARGDIIVCADAGCILDRDWIKNLLLPFKKKNTTVVAGYYKGLSENIFQKCLIPYVLVMPDKVNENKFLPAGRSMAFRKSVWEKIGGFPEKYSHNEDYVFANVIKKNKIKIFFAKNAIAYWLPRKNIHEAFVMFYRFALGDAQAKIFRPKVAFIFFRYLLGIIILFFAFTFRSYFILYSLCLIILVYIIWSIVKNYKYVKDLRAIYILPCIQFVSDAAVISGTIVGLTKYGI